MLILLPPIAAELARERNDLQLVLAVLGSDADGVVDAIDGFALDLARHERLAQFQLLLLFLFLVLALLIHLRHFGVGGQLVQILGAQ